MTDHQFECMYILLTGMANDLSAIRGLLEKQQARLDEEDEAIATHSEKLKTLAAQHDAFEKQCNDRVHEILQPEGR